MNIRELVNRGMKGRSIFSLCLAVLFAAAAVYLWTPAGPVQAWTPIPILSNNANLSNLGLSTGGLSPAFAPGTTSYTSTSNNPKTQVAPFVEESHATVTVNGTPVTSGDWSPLIPVNPGPNTIIIKVTAQNGITTKTYTITVTGNAASNNANLSNLGISTGSLAPAFAPGTTSYTSTSNYPYTEVKPFVEESHATITVNGTPVTSGDWAPLIPLNPGPNTVTIKVTAQNGITTKTYTITVTGNAASSNANLSHLYLSSGGLSPAFAPGTTSYTSTSNNPNTQVAPFVEESHATITVNGTPVTSGGSSPLIPLNPGPNTVIIKVTAQDGTTTKTYTVTVTGNAASSDANLSDLGLSTGSLAPAFAPGTTSYTSTSNNPKTQVKPFVEESHATVTVNGTPVTSGDWSPLIPLNPGPNTVTIKVTAQDGTTTKTYTVTVTGNAASSDANLSNLGLSTGSLAPAFDPGTTSYTSTSNNPKTQVKPFVEESHATVTVNGTPVTSGDWSPLIPVNPGPNTVTIKVTAQDGTTTKTYTITVTGNAASSDANLSNLGLSTGGLAPAFDPGTTSYTHTTLNGNAIINVRPTAEESHATITVNGTPVTSGQLSQDISLNVGDNTITIKVTAQDGITTKTYILTVTRQPAAQPPVQPEQTIMRYYIGGSDYFVNDQKKSMDTVPIIKDDRTLLPIRYVAEPLGATVDWDAADQKVTVTMKGKTIELWIDHNTARVSGVDTSIDPNNPNVAPIVVPPGRTMLPLRFIAENLGCQVDWNESTQEVKVTYPK